MCPAWESPSRCGRLDADAFGSWFAALLWQTCDEKARRWSRTPCWGQHGRPLRRPSAAISFTQLVIYAAPGDRPPTACRWGYALAALRFALRPSASNAERFERWAFFDFDRASPGGSAWFAAFSDLHAVAFRRGIRHVKRTMRQLVGSWRKKPVPDAELRRIDVPAALLCRAGTTGSCRWAWPSQRVPGLAGPAARDRRRRACPPHRTAPGVPGGTGMNAWGRDRGRLRPHEHALADVAGQRRPSSRRAAVGDALPRCRGRQRRAQHPGCAPRRARARNRPVVR